MTKRTVSEVDAIHLAACMQLDLDSGQVEYLLEQAGLDIETAPLDEIKAVLKRKNYESAEDAMRGGAG